MLSYLASALRIAPFVQTPPPSERAAQMRGLKFRVVVAHLLPASSFARLEKLFDVDLRIAQPVPAGTKMAEWLHGVAAVIADSRYVLDAPTIARLPDLKAFCNIDGKRHNLDLHALTKAGIRATSVPRRDGGAGQPAGEYRRWGMSTAFPLDSLLPIDDLAAGELAAAEIIASLGFGRNGWHPRYLLNPGVLCESCC